MISDLFMTSPKYCCQRPLAEGAQIVLVAVAVAVALAAAVVVVVVLFGFLFIVVKCRQGGDSLRRLLLLHLLHVVVIVIRCEPLNALQTLPHVAMRSRHFRCLSMSCA